MYANFPFTTPGRVCSIEPTALAMPKLTSFIDPSYEAIRLGGDTSRWTTWSGRPSPSRSSWAYWSPAHASAPMRATSTSGMRSVSACSMRSPACTPSTYSMAMK